MINTFQQIYPKKLVIQKEH